MPAQIVLVHNDAAFAATARDALMGEGFDVKVFPDPLAALESLEAAERLELLVTRVEFPPGRSNGAALALMARRRRPGVKVLFLCRPKYTKEVEDLGEVLFAPVAVAELVAAATRLLPALPQMN